MALIPQERLEEFLKYRQKKHLRAAVALAHSADPVLMPIVMELKMFRELEEIEKAVETLRTNHG